MYRPLLLSICTILLATSAQAADDWAKKMFEKTAHDFGVVARNAKTEFHFELVNPYAADIQIESVRTSCGCTTPKIVKRSLKTYESGSVLAVFNTDRFLGRRGATVTVTFSKPRRAEVQLSVKGYIRSDVVIQPSDIEFGSVAVGQGAERSTVVKYYGGNRNWSLTRATSTNKHIQTNFQQLRSTDGRPTYKVIAKLNQDSELGEIFDELTLHTTDGGMPKLSLMLTGRVLPPIAVSPSTLFLGVLPPGQKVQRNLVVRGKQPFRIMEVKTNNDSIEVTPSDEAKQIHILPITFTAGANTQKVDASIEIITDIDGVVGTGKISAAVVENAAKN